MYFRRGLKCEAVLHNREEAEDTNRRYKKNRVWYKAVYVAGALCKYAAYVNMGVRACTWLQPMGLLALSLSHTHTRSVILLFVRSYSAVSVGFVLCAHVPYFPFTGASS